jgi:hypothetical protein
MGAGPADVRLDDLGPISPELVLIDPVLAERARARLSDPPEPPRRPSRPAPQVAVAEIAAEPVSPAPKSRLGRIAALAVLIFGAGALAGSFLAEEHVQPAVAFETHAGAAPRMSTQQGQTSPAQTEARQRPARQTSRPGQARRSPAVAKRAQRAATTAEALGQARGVRRRVWATNVLGVTARVTGAGVWIAWKQPARSGHVVVLRARGGRGRGSVIFRGRATSYRDVSTRPCTPYRYTIVNYDRNGHSSTGVPTSLVTAGCI